jgi:hypothetical protein
MDYEIPIFFFFAFQKVYGCWTYIKSRSCYIAHLGLTNNTIHILMWNIEFLCLKLRLKEKYALLLVFNSMVMFYFLIDSCCLMTCPVCSPCFHHLVGTSAF